MGKRSKKCQLCSVKRKMWENENFYIIECKHHYVPMIVLTEHRAQLTADEIIEVEKIRQERFPELRARKKGMTSIRDHWHEHFIK